MQETIYSVYRCSRLETKTAVKAESAGFIFPCNFVCTVFARACDVAVHHAPRAAPQSCRFWRAVVAVLGCMTAPPTGRKQSYRAAACNEFWVIANICRYHMVR